MKTLRREMAKQRDIVTARLSILVLGIIVYLFILSRMINFTCSLNYSQGVVTSMADMIKSSLYRQTVFFVYIPVSLIYVYAMTVREIQSGRIVMFVNNKNYARTLLMEKILCVVSFAVLIAAASGILSYIVSGGKRMINFDVVSSAYFKETGDVSSVSFAEFEIRYLLYMTAFFYCVASVYDIIRLFTGKFVLSYILCVVAGIIVEFLKADSVISFNYTNIGSLKVIIIMCIVAVVLSAVEYAAIYLAMKGRDFL